MKSPPVHTKSEPVPVLAGAEDNHTHLSSVGIYFQNVTLPPLKTYTASFVAVTATPLAAAAGADATHTQLLILCPVEEKILYEIKKFKINKKKILR
jgi:hypothetical protein